MGSGHGETIMRMKPCGVPPQQIGSAVTCLLIGALAGCLFGEPVTGVVSPATSSLWTACVAVAAITWVYFKRLE
jgi:hypothetical protein